MSKNLPGEAKAGGNKRLRHDVAKGPVNWGKHRSCPKLYPSLARSITFNMDLLLSVVNYSNIVINEIN